jgi:hypothetical protein
MRCRSAICQNTDAVEVERSQRLLGRWLRVARTKYPGHSKSLSSNFQSERRTGGSESARRGHDMLGAWLYRQRQYRICRREANRRSQSFSRKKHVGFIAGDAIVADSNFESFHDGALLIRQGVELVCGISASRKIAAQLVKPPEIP